MNIKLRQATITDLPEVLTIIEAARELLKEQGSPQWQGGFGPTQEILEQDIKRGDLYLLLDDSEIVGTASLVASQDPAYEKIEGQWFKNSAHYVAIHRIAVARKTQNKGYATQFLALLIKKCQELGYSDIRIDTYPANKGMQAVIKKAGFTECGMIYFEIPHGERKAYQLLI